MTEEPKRGTSVTAFGVNGRSASAAARFRSSIDAIAASRAPDGAIPSRSACSTIPVPRGFVRKSESPGAAPAFGQMAAGMNRADDREAVLRLRIANRVPACKNRARGPYALVGAGEDVTERLDRKLLGKRRDGERQQRYPTHREHVVQRIRRCDRAKRARIVDERREEVDREHERALVIEPIHGGVVRRIESNEQILGLRRKTPRPPRSVSRRAAEYFAAQPPARARDVSGTASTRRV